jgi:hypothetical protein
MATSRAEESVFDQNINSGLPNNTIVQRYWHAHWVKANSKSDFSDRKDVETGLAELCADVWQGRLRSPPGFTPTWFESLIRLDFDNVPVPEKGNSDDVVLKTPYVRAKNSDIEAMARNIHLPANVLPPLNRRSFVGP